MHNLNIYLLRLFTGVILRVVAVALVLIGVEVAFSGTFSDLISYKFSVSTLGDLLVPAMGLKFWLVSGIGVSISVETNSSTAFLFWLLVVTFGEREREREVVLWKTRIFQRNLVFRNEVLT